MRIASAVVVAFLSLSLVAQKGDFPQEAGQKADFPQEAGQKADFPQEKRAAARLENLAKAIKVAPSDIRILGERQLTLHNLGGQYRVYKILNVKTGDSRRLALDLSGRLVDYEDLLKKEQAVHYKQYGNMKLALYRLVQQGQRSVIPVLIKVKVTEQPIDKTTLPVGRELEAAAPRAAKSSAQVESQAREILRAVCKERAVETAGQVKVSGPFISTRLSPAAIRILSRDPRIAFIGMNEEQEIQDWPTIVESLPTTRTNVVHGFGARGAGVKIAVLESGTTTKSPACFNIGATQDPAAGTNSHMTKSVAIIGNRYLKIWFPFPFSAFSFPIELCFGSWKGYAPESTVLLANESIYQDRYDWAKTQGVNIVTMSWHYGSEEGNGGLHSRDEYFDYATAHYPWPTVFTSAGNQADSAYASGKGFNFFGVANVLNDGDGNRYNDTISSSSSWKDPTSPHGDREVPEIASPGSRHALLDTSFGGTSAATPVTAAIASLLMSKNSSLKIWPEGVRAILLATANYQNADGANWSKYSDGKDGTGLTNTLYGYYTAGRREMTDNPQYRAHDYGSMTAGKFSGGFFEKSWKAYTSTTDSRIRIALTWNSKTDGTSSVLDADLDLWVYDPDMSLVTLSNTWDSSYEFVEFTPSKTGAYTIRIRGYSVPTDLFTYYGIAWTTHYDLGP